MLNHDSLVQLKGLKQQMEAEKERAEAVVKGTQARYGFAVLDDGREVFIPPDEMLKVFPEDRVRVCIRPTKDKRTVADVEKLVDSPLGDFTGRCVRKGRAMFVQPDLPQLTRWLFLPPHARNGAKEGDYLRCAVLRHPIRDGKPQAKVLEVIGNEATPGIENLYCQKKYRLQPEWPADLVAAIEKSLAARDPLQCGTRRDLTDLEFVSIDSARTQDIDDALYAEISSTGWVLYIAISDPTAYVEADSDLEQEIARRGTSTYFHGDVVPMLPEILSQERCALSEGVDRAALVCKVEVADDGTVGAFEFIEATVRSRAKLSYYGVDRYLAGNYDELMSHATPLEALYQVYRALRARREERELVMEDRQEYRWMLNDQKKIESIEPHEKLLSQKLVEECMIAANRCAALYLQDQQLNGPFVCHSGFRKDREEDARKFLQRYLPDQAEADLYDRTAYRDIIRGLSGAEHDLPLRAMVNRLLNRAELTTKPGDHMGMGLPCYTNCTSPLRKYVDYLVHRQIKAKLHERQEEIVSAELLAQLSRVLGNTREATAEAERWLVSDYMTRLVADDPKQVLAATVCHINSSGFSVRLNDTGLEGFVDLRQDPEKFSFDRWTASLTSTTRRFALEQPVEVTFAEVVAEDRSLRFEVVPGCGLKPPKQEAVAAEKD